MSRLRFAICVAALLALSAPAMVHGGSIRLDPAQNDRPGPDGDDLMPGRRLLNSGRRLTQQQQQQQQQQQGLDSFNQQQQQPGYNPTQPAQPPQPVPAAPQPPVSIPPQMQQQVQQEQQAFGPQNQQQQQQGRKLLESYTGRIRSESRPDGALGGRNLLQFSGRPQLMVVDFSNKPMQAVGWAYDDEGSGALRDISVFRPPQSPSGVWYTGYTSIGRRAGTINPGEATVTTLAVIGGGNIGEPGFPIANPIGWERKWGLSKSGRAYLMQMPQCPGGYVALGGYFHRDGSRGFSFNDFVRLITDISSAGTNVAQVAGLVGQAVQQAETTTPSNQDTGNLVCVRQDLTVPARGGTEIWNDHGSGAQDDGSLWVAQAGPDGIATGSMVAQSGYNQPQMYVLKKSAVLYTQAP